MKLLIFVLIFCFFSCSRNTRQFEEYNLPVGGAVILKEYNHKHGFKESQCFFCHVKGNIHQDNTTESSVIDLARELTQIQGIESCHTCHGSNGL